MTKRITSHPVLGTMPERKKINFKFDGKTYEGYEGETIAAALLANGIRTLRKHEHTGHPRGIYCNIGHCFECRVTVNDASNIRACLTPIQENMVVESGEVLSDPLSPDNPEQLRTYEDFKRWEEKQ